MEWKIGESYEGFRLIEERKIEEINGIGRHFLHEASGVTLIHLSNDDAHKVFSIGFQTLPQNNQGAAHVVEHSVCCASKNYPLKETFVALQQGSINTALNACTYPDMTMYYAASPNEKDLMGLATVYLDLVFHPLIHEKSDYFKQEGWHYTLEDVKSPLEYSGVVYHEMEGEYAEVGAWLEFYKMKSLFPDTSYQFDAGGIPEEIPELTESAFLAFYDKHYVGSNAYITLYGNGDIKSQLKILNEQGLIAVKPDHYSESVVKQKPFSRPEKKQYYYPTEDQQAQKVYNMSFVIGECIDHELRLSMELLEHMLIRSEASPLLKRLVLEEEMGISLSEGGYDACRKQPVFSITLKGCKEKTLEEFEQVVINELERLVTEGIPRKLVEASLHTLTFELREVDASYEPIGVQYSEMMLNHKLHGGNCFDALLFNKTVEKIKASIDQGYFEQLINRYFLQNNHRITMSLVPDMKLFKKMKAQKEKKLKFTKLKMSESDCRTLICDNERLEEEQLVENSPEALALLPRLTKTDLPLHLPEMKYEHRKWEGCDILFYPQETHGIAYFHFLFDVSFVKKEDIPYLGLVAHLFSYVGTNKKNYSEVENAINRYTGGLHSGVHAYTLYKQEGYATVFKVSGKTLVEDLDNCMRLLEELFLETCFKEYAKLKEAMGHILFEIERSFNGAPEYRSAQRLYTYFTPVGVYEEQVAGLPFYHEMKRVYENFDVEFESLRNKLQNLLRQVFQKNGLRVVMSSALEDEDKMKDAISTLLIHLPQYAHTKQELKLMLNTPREGFCVGQDVQAIVQGFDYKKQGFKYHGSLEVICNVLENTYLWDRIRLQGGAYGCEIILGRDGDLVISSYCDPNLRSTLKVFNEIGHYLTHFDMNEEVLEGYIISTLGNMLVPLSHEQKTERACNDWITGITHQDRERVYQEILYTHIADFKQSSQLFDAFAKANCFCVIGGKNQILKEKDLFEVIHLGI